MHYSIAWNPFHKSISEGLSNLQQNEELVDMTIAADGHFVKVHQLIMCLASPYLKKLITSAPCQHPVVFLNNVPSHVLTFLLQYIYTGEVVVPEICIAQFACAGKALHIEGLEHLPVSKSVETIPPSSASIPTTSNTSIKRVLHSHTDSKHGIKRIILDGGDSKQVPIPLLAKNIKIESTAEPTHQSQAVSSNFTVTKEFVKSQNSTINEANKKRFISNDESENVSISNNNDVDDPMDKLPDKTNQPDPLTDNTKSTVQFSSSIRGSLQVILNRRPVKVTSLCQTQCVRNAFSRWPDNNKEAGTRRWRCIDYRGRKCSAYLITKDNLVLKRGNIHNHSFHDKKILEKVTKNAVYSKIEEVKTDVIEESDASSNESEVNATI